MPKSIMLVAVLCAAAASAAGLRASVAEPMVRHAGQWETTIGNGKPIVLCYPTDQTFDQNTVLKQMARIPGANCTMSNMTTTGNVTSYALQCTIGGSQMTSSGTITVTGPDAYTSKAHSHGGRIPTPNGQTADMPDMDMVTVSHRTGPCQPGDRQAPVH
jgi:hypothetical protein